MFVYFVDCLILLKKRPPPAPPKMADISSEEKVSAGSFYLGIVHPKFQVAA